jgi:mannose-1-phosphate guanylyltransferase
VKQVEDVSQFGVTIFNQEGFIKGFQEKPSPEDALSNFASTGIYVLEPEVFKYIPPTGSYGFGRQLFPQLVESNLPVLAVEISDYWSDVGTIDQYKQSNFDALKGSLRLHLPACANSSTSCHLDEGAVLEEGVTLAGDLLLGKRSRVARGASLKGRVIIGDDCYVGNNVVLEDTIIWSGSTIESGARLTDCIIGGNCTVTADERPVGLVTVASTPALSTIA